MNVIDESQANLTFPIAVVVSRFNSEVTERLLKGALERLTELQFPPNQITVVWVPGAVEIPLVSQRIAQQSIVEAVVCLGAVIRGETDHYQYVCDQVSQGCQQVALQNDVPIIFGVLTTENEEQALSRCLPGRENKGYQAVNAAVEMVSILRRFD